MSKRRSPKQRRSQRILWALSLVLVASMMISLVIVALPSQPAPTPTPLPTFPLAPLATSTATLRPTQPAPTATATLRPTQPAPTATATLRPTQPVPTSPPTPSPPVEATEAEVGPVLPTESPTLTPTLAITFTLPVTPAGASLDLTFAVCGDSRDNPATYGKVLQAVTADGSEFLLHTGDLVNQGTEAQWQQFQEMMASFALPFYPVPGNHDSLDGKLDGYLAYSGAPAAHYSFDRGPVHCALADSHNGGVGANELAWLQNDLAATEQPIKMVILHHPPFDPDGSDHIMAWGNESFMSLMAEQQVGYVFAGHIHAYAQEERDGVIYTITGGAGAPLYREGHPQAFHHYLRVTVRDGKVAIEVVRV